MEIKGEKDSFSTTFYYASDLEAIKQAKNTTAVIYLFNLIRNYQDFNRFWAEPYQLKASEEAFFCEVKFY